MENENENLLSKQNIFIKNTNTNIKHRKAKMEHKLGDSNIHLKVIKSGSK